MSIQDGSTVTMHFTMTSEGQALQSSVGGEPFTFVQGQGQMFPTVEEALVGMSAGETKAVTLSPEQAFGEVNPDAVQQVPKSGFQDPSALAVGGEVRGQTKEGPFSATVTAIDDDTVTLDLNHPLAGKTLTFEIEVVNVE